MTDRPIIFSAPMIHALLDGRKTQTRRVLKPQPESVGDKIEALFKYRVDDRLWVRETWLINDYRYERPIPKSHPEDLEPDAVLYRTTERDSEAQTEGIWRPSIHMPRWASRLTLVVTQVRVQRLREISETDAAAEGVEMESADPPFYYVPGIWPHSITAVGIEEPGGRHAARSFAKLWNSIHGPNAWWANPWVCALTFTVHRCNIDQMDPAP